MPVDFEALPDRRVIPEARRAIVPWLIALVVILAVGAATSIATWAADRPMQTSWFWIRTFGLPFLLWQLLYSAWRFVHAHRLRDALADNAAIDLKEQQLHDEASVPFAVLGQSWFFSCDVDQNRTEDAMKIREPAEMTGLFIPGRPFFRGNEADEAQRHAQLLEWLLVGLIRPLANELNGLRRTSVWFCLDSILPADVAKAVVSRAWAVLGLRQAENVRMPETMSLYAIDDWLDISRPRSSHLAVAIQLRGAISGDLMAGQAEAGAAVLLASTSTESLEPGAVVHAHRPARCRAESFAAGIANALRWGRCVDGAIETSWNSGLANPLVKAFRSLQRPVTDAPAIELARTVGDAGVATPWLALALAAEKAKGSAGAQLILDQLDGDLVAMICRKKA